MPDVARALLRAGVIRGIVARVRARPLRMRALEGRVIDLMAKTHLLCVEAYFSASAICLRCRMLSADMSATGPYQREAYAVREGERLAENAMARISADVLQESDYTMGTRFAAAE
ncbi:MAG: hypothetical protein ACLT98_09075 [Eggerthellaceae bacterium]